MIYPFEPVDDLFHRTPALHRVVLVWREHMYINAWDPRLGFAAVHHLQLQPGTGTGNFNAVYKHGEVVERYSQRSGIPTDLSASRQISDGTVTVEVVEPARRLRVRFRGERFQSDLHYTGRFHVFDYNHCPAVQSYSPLGEIGRRMLTYNSLVQSLTVQGEVVVDGVKHAIDGIANRDHSWGMRNESVFEWHYWGNIDFADRFFNFLAMRNRTGEPPVKYGGVVNRPDSQQALRHVDIIEEPAGAERPQRIRYCCEDVHGKVYRVSFDAAHAFGPIYFPNIPVEEGKIYEMLDLWGTWTDEDTGEQGRGLNEIGRMKDAATVKGDYAR